MFTNYDCSIGARCTTYYDFGLVWMNIAPAWPEDEAEYTCVAINKWGQDQTTGKLHIEPIQEVGEPPKFVTQLPSPGSCLLKINLRI